MFWNYLYTGCIFFRNLLYTVRVYLRNCTLWMERINIFAGENKYCSQRDGGINTYLHLHLKRKEENFAYLYIRLLFVFFYAHYAHDRDTLVAHALIGDCAAFLAEVLELDGAPVGLVRPQWYDAAEPELVGANDASEVFGASVVAKIHRADHFG